MITYQAGPTRDPHQEVEPAFRVFIFMDPEHPEAGYLSAEDKKDWNLGMMTRYLTQVGVGLRRYERDMERFQSYPYKGYDEQKKIARKLQEDGKIERTADTVVGAF